MFHMIVMANNNIQKNGGHSKDVSVLREVMPFKEDLVARWEIPLYDGVHLVEFEHGTTSGKRVVTIDGKEIIRRDWMFRLVGDEVFILGSKSNENSEQSRQHTITIRVDPRPAFNYEYYILVDGLPLEEFIEKQSLILIFWKIPHSLTNGEQFRVVLDKKTLDIWVNGKQVETEGEFTDNGTKMNFEIQNSEAFILGTPTGDKKEQVLYDFYFKNIKIDEHKY